MTNFLLGLVGAGLGWAAFGLPLLWLGIRSGRKEPEKAKARAVPWALAVAAWSGLHHPRRAKGYRLTSER